MTVFFNSGKYSSSNLSERLNNSLLQNHEWRKLFSDIPVAVNNFLKVRFREDYKVHDCVTMGVWHIRGV